MRCCNSPPRAIGGFPQSLPKIKLGAARAIKFPVPRPSDDYKDRLWFHLISSNYDFESVATMSLKNLSEAFRPLFDREY